MVEGGRKRIPGEALINLRRRLDTLPPRHPERATLLQNAASLYGVSRATLYRQLQQHVRPKSIRRVDRGKPRKLPTSELERYCEIIAALKLRTSNKKGRHLSTNRAIELLEGEGVETPDGLVRISPGMLTRTTVNRYLRDWGYDHARMTRAPAAVRFQARHSNELWHFDLSPSDLKEVEKPLWFEPGRGCPTLILYSAADDRSGVAYQEYRCVYGEDVEAGLRFLFNAMAPKPDESGLVMQGIPDALYMDNGPITRSRVFQNVMESLGVRMIPHLPVGKDGRRITARSKGKVERPFRTVKEAHETLYHFHRPENEAEANLWLHRYLVHYNSQPHRIEPHSRLEDWLRHLPEQGLRQMCTWERFCAFAREPERRLVGGDARLTVEGVIYEVAAELAGETVILWWGCSTRTSMSSMVTGASGPTRRVAALFRCTATASTRRARSRSVRTGWPSLLFAWACHARPSRERSRRRDPCGRSWAGGRSATRTRSNSWRSPARSRQSTRSPTSLACHWRGCRLRTEPSSMRCCATRWKSPLC
jgi:hypothetical protein